MRKGFTLIELLIVVAIIAILAAIAVPNFLEAQVRAKVSRAKNDLRALATGIEAYAVDHSKYPIDGHAPNDAQAFWYVPGGPTVPGGVAGVSSPVAYLTTARLVDPFRTTEVATAAMAADAPDSQYFDLEDYKRFRYTNWLYTYRAASDAVKATYTEIYGTYRLSSSGPDRTHGPAQPGGPSQQTAIYDPTNGTISSGDIVRSQKMGEHNKITLN